MPNITSAKKRVRQIAKRQVVNNARKSDIKTAIKKVLLALESNDIDQAKTLLRETESKISRARGKGLLHPNAAARKVSRLAHKVSTAARA